jgi:hypothetical protein
MSDKLLREKAAKSDRKMRSTPIAELYFQFYYKGVSKEMGRVNEKGKLFLDSILLRGDSSCRRNLY